MAAPAVSAPLVVGLPRAGPAPRSGSYGSGCRVLLEQRIPEPIDNLGFLGGQLPDTSPGSAESLVAAGSLGHLRDFRFRQMNLPRPPAFGSREVLRDVSFPLIAAASLMPADATALADGAADEPPALGQHTRDVLLPLGLEGPALRATWESISFGRRIQINGLLADAEPLGCTSRL